MTASTTAFAQGTLASRPAAAAGNQSYYYFATDDHGGTLYQSTGSAWVQLAAPVLRDMVRAYASATAQSLTSGTVTSIVFDTNDTTYSSNTAMHSTVSNTSRLVAQVAGRYEIKAQVNYAANSTGIRQAALLVNGTTSIAVTNLNNVGGFGSPVPVATEYYFAASDYVEVTGYQNSGGALAIQQGASVTWMTMRRVG